MSSAVLVGFKVILFGWLQKVLSQRLAGVLLLSQVENLLERSKEIVHLRSALPLLCLENGFADSNALFHVVPVSTARLKKNR